MKIALTLAVVIIAAAYVWWDYNRTPIRIIESPKAISMDVDMPKIPDAEFKTLKGDSFNLHDFRGKTILLNFWATWCAPCVVEFPQMLELAEKRQADMVFLALSVDQNPANIETFFSRLPKELAAQVYLPNVIIGLDTDKAISQDLFQTVLYPETYIIGPDLKPRQKIVGVTDWLSGDIAKTLNALTAQVNAAQ